MKARFMVYEIEHGGDRDNAVEALEKAGCSKISVVVNFDAEAMLVECELPAGVASVKDLGELEGVCL